MSNVGFLEDVTMIGSLASTTACRWAVSVIALLAPQFALAQDAPREFVTYSFPKGWSVEADKSAAIATPSPGTFEQSVSVQVCSRASSKACSETCEPAELRPNYFYFFKGQPMAVYSEPLRGDGLRELRGQGPFGKPTSWVAASVLCSHQGLVFVGSTSTRSLEDAVAHLNEVIASIRLQPPVASPTK